MIKNLNECVIANIQLPNNDVILAKNRDRNYSPAISIIRELTNEGVEIVYLLDKSTNWKEGMNSFGIGIINTALMVVDDENAIDKKKNKKNARLNDGDMIYKALQQSNLEDCLNVLINHKGGLKGHTLLSDGKKLIHLEYIDDKEPVIISRNLKKSNVFTNHGEEISGAGYEKSDGLISSVLRQAQVRLNLKNVSSINDVISAFSKGWFRKQSRNNIKRETNNMKTTSQMFLNLSSLEFILIPLISTLQKFNGLIDKTPDDYKPKIRITILNDK